MATCDAFETTISATHPDNDSNPYATTTLPKSDGGAQCRAPGEEADAETSTPKQEATEGGGDDDHQSLPLPRMPKLKREKSYSETLERRKKRVKFSADEGDEGVIVDTRVFDSGDGDANGSALSSTIKKFLRKKSKKRKASIETQTEKDGEETKHSRRDGRQPATVEASVPPSPEEDLTQYSWIVSSPESSTPEAPIAGASEETPDTTEPPEAGTPRVPDGTEGERDATRGEDAERCVTEERTDSEDAERCVSEERTDSEDGCDRTDGRDAVARPDDRYQYDRDVPHQEAPLTEEEELEISRSEESTPEDLSPAQATVKREGTFTLEGPPPAKITKPSCDAEAQDPEAATPPRDSIMEPLLFFVDLDAPNAKASEESPASSRKIAKKPVLTSSKYSPKAKRSAKVADDKKVADQSSTVKCLKNNAKRTLVKAWKTATKTQDAQGKPAITREAPTPKPLPPKPQQEKPTKTNALLKHTDPKRSAARETPKKEPRETLRRLREPTTDLSRLRSPQERNSVWAGVSLPTFRREGTFTKKYDSERDRLQAECNRLNVEKDRLQSEVTDARARLEDEVVARKALRRTHDLDLRHLREGELRRTELLLTDTRNRLEDEKREALAQQKEALTRIHDADMARANRERDEEHRRLQLEARNAMEKLKAEMRKEVASRPEHPPIQCCHSTERDLDRLNRDLVTLREHKKRLEEAVQTLQETERKRAGELRRLHDQHETAIAKIHRANKSEAARLLDEIRSKERTIGQLERQVSTQSAKLRQQEEKQREGSSERAEDASARKQTTRGGGPGATSKRQKEGSTSKDGRPREKESCVSHTINNNHHHHLPSQPGGERPQSVESETTSSDLHHDHPTDPHPTQAMAAEVEHLRCHIEQQKTQMEQQIKQLEEQKQEWDHEQQRMLKELEQQQDTIEMERERFRDQIQEKLLQIEDQKEVMEAQKEVMEEQRLVMEEQQLRIVELTDEVMEQDCLASLPPQTSWHPRRESCVKVCELPTVMEQNSDDESTPISTPPFPTTPTTPPSDTRDHLSAFTLDEPSSSTAFLTPITPGTEPPVWPEVTESKMSTQYAQLSREHQELQKSYQLLASTSVPNSPGIDFKGKDGPAEWWMAARVLELEALSATLKMELQETRDHADLLEFRCLEITEGADKGPECSVDKVDQSTSTDLDDSSIAVANEDLSLPLSIDSGLDISNDYKKARVSEGRFWLAELCRAAGDQVSPAAQHLAALLDWVAALPAHNGPPSPMSPTLVTPTAAAAPKGTMGVEEVGCDLGRDLTLIAARLQESLADPVAQEPILLDTITKLRLLDSNLCQLQERVVNLTEENRELHEAVASLSEAHETRTEASGTESELVHRKTPSIHSDLSDAESESPEHVQHHRPVKMVSGLDAATSFQESGIFDTSCEMVHVTTQTDLESDEYLKAALDEERVSLSKLEYDSIVEGERRLQQELEHLKCDKEQLMLECDSLKDKITTFTTSRGTDAEEALKGEIRVTKQRLAASERARREMFDEKCELEEEENDSRLMVQRLESQMEAAREMENLLSASLSQEQEISRELHRRVRDLQILEKDHRGRLEKLECVNRRAEEKAATHAKARDALAAQLTFTTLGLIVADYFRYMVPQSAVALVPYTGKTLKVFPGRYPMKALVKGKEISNTLPVCDPVVSDVCVQTCLMPPAGNASMQSQMEQHCVGMQCLDKLSPEEHGQRRAAERDEDEPASKRPRNISTKSQATMTQKSETLSEREQFYLEQIESLQREKISLRKGQDHERRDSLQHHHDLEEEVSEMRLQLDEAERVKCNLLLRLEEAQDGKEEVKHNLLLRIEELKGDISRYNDMHELERKALRQDYDARLREVEEERNQQEEQARQLGLQLSTFRQELEIVGVSVANDLVEMDSEMENVLSQSVKSPMKNSEGDGELLDKIRELVKSEASLRQRIYDLEKKECAYRETIHEADKIMSSHVTSYKKRIEELEAATDQQVSKIQQLEASEERLRCTLRNNSRTSEGARISDLLDRLIETESSELKLKERVWNLERSEKELQIKLMEGEKTNQCLRGELRDQEELVHRLMALETENNALSAELNQAQDSTRKISEVQQNESYLRSRVEELEVTENMLRETLHQADLILAQREKKLRDQVASLQEEVQSYRSQLEAAASKEYGARESEVSYRRQLEELRCRLAETERELKESSSETMSHETQHRSEVTKLRNQLKLCNAQLLELDRLNCELRDRVMAAEAEGQRLARELEESNRRHEQDLLTFNLQISSRDSQVEELQSQLEQMSHAHAASELDVLATSPIAALYSSITALTTALRNCESCNAAQNGTLTEVTNQLGTLAELLEGQPSCPNMEDITSDADEEDASESFETDTAENLANEATTTPPPNPAGEGLREQSSGDANNCATSGIFLRDTHRRSRRRLEERGSSRRLLRPQGSSTILEELEEKVRELEEAVGRKEEELRLADVEASEVNSQLQSRDIALSQKGEEVEHLNATLASLRQQLVHTMGDAERARLSIQTKHKVDLEELTRRVEQLTEKAENLARRGQLKDSIISTLASQIRAILRSGNMGIVIDQLRHLSKADQGNLLAGNDKRDHHLPAIVVPDFDVDTVCLILSQPDEDVTI